MAAPPTEYIYSMYKVSRTFPAKGKVLEDISLSFFPGARIGVLGYNLYQAKKQPEGFQINVGPDGLKIKTK